MSLKLSILVPSVAERFDTFRPRIERELYRQVAALPENKRQLVEIIVLSDTKSIMLGEKRNILVDLAGGEYVVFVDDDDRISPDYITTLLEATSIGADVITFDVAVTLNGGELKIAKYSVKYEKDHNTEEFYYRLPNHICCVKKEISQKSAFPNLVYSEDTHYALLLAPHIKTEHNINRVLYYYDYNDLTTVAQVKSAARRMRHFKHRPVVDVIFLSKTDSPAIYEMTAEAIRSCKIGANGLNVNVIVVESEPGVSYPGAQMIEAPEQFNYNKFANIGAKKGKTDWFVIANNDVIFYDAWLHELLAVGKPLMSPKCPDDARQRDITELTEGDQCGRHLSGWCFMISRSLWGEIGGFDEDFDFWFADNALIAQALKAGVTPAIVPTSQVRHLGSKTLNTLPVAKINDLKWSKLELFNQRYNQTLFTNEKDYLRWRKNSGVH